jgi:hypothetical protein
MTAMSAAPAQDTGRTLDLDEILVDEYAALYPGSGVTPAGIDDPDGYAFSTVQVRDLPTLARLICDGAVPVPNPSPTRAGLLAIADGQDALVAEAHWLRDLPQADDLVHAATFTDLLVARLNALLSVDLVTDPRFRDLRLLAGVVDADAAASRRPRANRLLLEAALAPAVTRLRDVRVAALHARVRHYTPTAICLSGGGIRSCTFALGVVTALARHRLLGKFDYLSTVSGGGYLGGWLSAWMVHEGAETVQRQLAGHSGTTLDPEPGPLYHLRAYSSFLAPRLGVLSADTWTLIGTLIRNLLLNWLVILPLLAGAVMLPRAAVSFLRYGEYLEASTGVAGALPILLALSAFALGTRALAYVYRQRPGAVDAESSAPSGPALSSVAERTQRAFMWRCLVPLVGASLAFSSAWWLFGTGVTESTPAWVWCGPAMAMNLLGWMIGSHGRRRRPVDAAVVATSGAAGGVLAPKLLDALSALADQQVLQAALNLPPYLLRPRLFVALAVPLFLLLIMIAGQLLVGLSSTRCSNADGEWNARLNGWLLIVMLTWVSVCGIVLFLPPLIENGWRDPRFLGLHAIGGLSGLIAALLGASATTPSGGAAARASAGSPGVSMIAKRTALALAAPVFAISLIGVLSVFNAQVLLRALCNATPAQCQPASTGSPTDVQQQMEHVGDYAPAGLILLASLSLMAGGWALGRLIDTNQFSLHAMYRSRLVRTFLGASRSHAERVPDPFTGFDEQDDLPVGALWPPPLSSQGPPRDRDETMPPLHVINLTLNLVARRSLAWQERKAESMTVSSLHAGGPFLGYRRTRVAGVGQPRPHGAYGGPQGISLGTAITISGAAASPEAGYNSSPFISFLMALFNARLGWWLGNPGAPGDRTFERSGPRGGITPVLSEMFGLTTDRSEFVFLSDGGHFDNLGLYTMVLRRCRVIVVSDAGCDPNRTFDDLGNAIRKIRIDLGVPIEFGSDQPLFGGHAATDGAAFPGWAVGRIRYSQVDRPQGSRESDEEYDGVLVYLKPTLCGGEPMDVVNYAHRSETFPHESTTDQFFTESQFESYRSLGMFEADSMCRALGLESAPEGAVGDGTLHSTPIRWLERQRTAVDVARPVPPGAAHATDSARSIASGSFQTTG